VTAGQWLGLGADETDFTGKEPAGSYKNKAGTKQIELENKSGSRNACEAPAARVTEK
jgi:hypothetical protein